MDRIDQEWRESGFEDHLCSGEEVTWPYARRRARNCIFHYPEPRYAKIMRARLRRYQRLQYLYKLQPPTFPWPPFTHPEFPVEPALEMWRRGIHTDYRQPVWVTAVGAEREQATAVNGAWSVRAGFAARVVGRAGVRETAGLIGSKEACLCLSRTTWDGGEGEGGGEDGGDAGGVEAGGVEAVDSWLWYSWHMPFQTSKASSYVFDLFHWPLEK
ncbi:hypothetical protein B0H14DRAFT_2616365 [Mycena olivaceomarginata]|nr:hypothetical protein B0H14DRAFT_2616365 [Mycena olivaceomarginata]